MELLLILVLFVLLCVGLPWLLVQGIGTVGSRAESRRVRYLESMARDPNADPVNVMGEHLDLAGYNIYRVSEKRVIISCKGLDELEIAIWSDFRRGEPYGVVGAFGVGGSYHASVTDAWVKGRSLFVKMAQSPGYAAQKKVEAIAQLARERQDITEVRSGEEVEAQEERDHIPYAKGITRPGQDHH